MSPESRSKSRMRHLPLLVGLLVAALSVSALGQSQPFPTYSPGENTGASTGPTFSAPLSNPWVVSDGTILTPAGTQVYLGITTRAKAIALNPSGNGTAAVLQMGAPQAVSIFCVAAAGCGAYSEGQVIQNYNPFGDSDGSATGIAYTANGAYLLFSQDGYNSAYGYGTAYVAIASVNPTTGMLSDSAQVGVPLDLNWALLATAPPTDPLEGAYLTTVTCFPNSPGGTSGSFDIPCSYPVSIFSDDTFTSYPLGLAISPSGTTAYSVLDNNNTLAEISLATATEVGEVRVGNVPNSVVISPNGATAYVSNEAGRVALATDFQEYSNGTPVVASYPTGSTSTGTVSVVNLATFTVTSTINVGLHPTAMAVWGNNLLVVNTYSDSISVINTTTNQVTETINLALGSVVGLGPNSIAVDQTRNLAYVALYNANAIAVVDLNLPFLPPLGLIPVGYAPSSVVLDTVDNELLVANDKGIGTTGFAVATPPGKTANTAENSYGDEYGVYDFNTHQDLGTVSIVPVPNFLTLAEMTAQVFHNNHWDLWENIFSASGGGRWAPPAAIPANIGSPSLIKHVFVIIRENRTYDQILGDVAGGNGDPSLAVFGDSSSYVADYPVVTPNAHALLTRFPLLDNFYDPSRQSADGHNWITQAMAPYSDDIQSPDWLRDYPSNGGDAIAYQAKGHLWDTAAAAGVRVKNYGEYIEYNTFNTTGCTGNLTQANSYNGPGYAAPLPFVVSDGCEPSWADFYNDTLEYEAGNEAQLQYWGTIGSVTPLPNLSKITVPNYPQFDLGIPDQYRVDVWKQDFANDLAKNAVPQLEFLWIMSDHTTGPPNAIAEQADNDLAVGRVIDIISHSNVWSTSAIFVEEDDAQNGVDHVDGHRSPGYVISPYVIQVPQPNNSTPPAVHEDPTFYTQVNVTRTIEQILGIPPMNQNDLVASPMRTLFINNPPPANFNPWTHVPNQVPLCYGVEGYTAPVNIPPSLNTCSSANPAAQDSPAAKVLREGWHKMKAEVFAARYHTPDSLDPDTVSHYDWYDATGYKVPFPGEKAVRPASDFSRSAAVAKADDDD